MSFKVHVFQVLKLWGCRGHRTHVHHLHSSRIDSILKDVEKGAPKPAYFYLTAAVVDYTAHNKTSITDKLSLGGAPWAPRWPPAFHARQLCCP